MGGTKRILSRYAILAEVLGSHKLCPIKVHMRVKPAWFLRSENMWHFQGLYDNSQSYLLCDLYFSILYTTVILLDFHYHILDRNFFFF